MMHRFVHFFGILVVTMGLWFVGGTSANAAAPSCSFASTNGRYVSQTSGGQFTIGFVQDSGYRALLCRHNGQWTNSNVLPQAPEGATQMFLVGARDATTFSTISVRLTKNNQQIYQAYPSGGNVSGQYWSINALIDPAVSRAATYALAPALGSAVLPIRGSSWVLPEEVFINYRLTTTTPPPVTPPQTTEPGPFTLSVAAECVLGQPNNVLSWTASESAAGYTVFFVNHPQQIPVSYNSNVHDYTDPQFGGQLGMGEQYEYVVMARHASGKVRYSNFVSVAARSDCDSSGEPPQEPPPQEPQPAPSVSITPVLATLSPGEQQQFVATIQGAGDRTASVRWCVTAVGSATCLTDPQAGEVSQTGLFTASASPGEYPGVVRAVATVDGAEYPATASVVIRSVSQTSGQIQGDIYSRGNIGNLTVSADSVVSANGAVEVGGTRYTIANYSRVDEEQTAETLSRLKREKAVRLSTGDYTLTGLFNLNPRSGSPSDLVNNVANPEGGVWYVPGNLIVGTVTMYGKGTIIVGGSVSVLPGAARRLTSGPENALVLGIIAETGNISLSGLQLLRGAYYAPEGTVTLGAGTSATGLFVGKSIVLESSDIDIRYDGQISVTPPPGFSEAFVPSLSEVAP